MKKKTKIKKRTIKRKRTKKRKEKENKDKKKRKQQKKSLKHFTEAIHRSHQRQQTTNFITEPPLVRFS